MHDLVDYVSQEASLAAKGAVQYLKSYNKSFLTIPFVAKKGIAYIVPQKIVFPSEEKIECKFRVPHPMKQVTIQIKADEQVLKEWKKSQCMPSEMEKFMLDLNLLPKSCKELSIQLQEDEK